MDTEEISSEASLTVDKSTVIVPQNTSIVFNDIVRTFKSRNMANSLSKGYCRSLKFIFLWQKNDEKAKYILLSD